MIDPRVFMAGMTLLGERFNRQPTDVMLKSYRALLEPQLDNQEFQLAVQTLLYREKFWPAPVDFVEAVKGSIADQAETEWALVAEYAKAGGGDLHVSPAAKKALTSIGGTWALRTEKLDFLRRDFLRAYEAHAREHEREQLRAALPAEVAR